MIRRSSGPGLALCPCGPQAHIRDGLVGHRANLANGADRGRREDGAQQMSNYRYGAYDDGPDPLAAAL